jgi:hypothetical protein
VLPTQRRRSEVELERLAVRDEMGANALADLRGGQPETRLSLVRISMSRRSAQRASAQVLRMAAVSRVALEARPLEEEVGWDMSIKSFRAGGEVPPCFYCCISKYSIPGLYESEARDMRLRVRKPVMADST